LKSRKNEDETDIIRDVIQ